MRDWIRRNCLLLLFVLANVAIASPVSAGLDDNFCQGDEGGVEHCCTGCIFFCHCSLTE